MSGLYVRTTITAQTRTAGGKLIQGVTRATEKLADETLSEISDDVILRMQQYPPPIPNSKYKRTGLLGRSWKKIKNNTASRTGYKIVNMAARKGHRYAGYVVGDAVGEGQARIHQGRWPVFREKLDALMSFYKSKFLAKLKVYIGRERVK